MTAKQEEEERNRSYRASQKLLRKNASTLSIKDALSRSMTVQEVTVDSQPLPLSTIDHPTSSSSSPATALPQLGVHDITARFLMKVRSSRSLTIDNILRKDKSQQMINTSVDSARDGLFPDLEAAELLVLEDENANAAAPLVKEPLLSSLLASGRLDEASRGTTTTVMAKEGPARESQRTLSDDEREAEHDRITAQLRRKHEMLRLRSAAAVDSRSLPSSLHASLTPKLPLTDSLHSLPSSPLSTEVVGPGPKKVMDSATGSAVSALLPAGMSSMALRQAGLQQRAANFLKAVQGDVQLLKRTNSFENSAQKPIVFAASEKVKKAPSGSNT
jgi:hypothetical protein